MELTIGEITPKAVYTEPLSEALANADAFCALWPEATVRHPELVTQVFEHSQQIQAVETIFQKLPAGMQIERAIETGVLTSDETSHFFDQLSQVIEDPDYERLVLYLPFEVLPSANWANSDIDLELSFHNFKRSYLHAWCNLLGRLDIRANFINGDIPEMQLRSGDLPCVVKAVHLIPPLIERDWLTLDDIAYLSGSTHHPQLVHDLEEVLSMFDNRDIESEKTHTNHVDLVTIFANINKAAFSDHDELSHDLPPGRRQWLMEQKEELFIEETAQQLTEAFATHVVTLAQLKSALTDNSDFHFRLYIETLRQTSLTLEKPQPEQCKALISTFLPELIAAFPHLDSRLQQCCSVLFRHLHARQLIPEDIIRQLNIHYTDFAPNYSENATYMKQELEQVRTLVESIQDDKQLQHCIEPIALVGGSRLKGYGETSSDTDIALFVKPIMDHSWRTTLQARIRELSAQQGIEEPTAIWLKKTASGLRVHDFGDDDPHTASPSWTHTLFNTLWVGDATRIGELRQKLIPFYFYAFDEDGNEQQSRREYLERLEQDSLQYRLMHKGYRRHQPENSVSKRQSSLPEADSVFWDAGYRQIATRLFLKTVFLPRIY